MPLDPDLTSHTQRATKHKSLSDWVAVSESSWSILKHDWSDNLVSEAVFLDHLVESDHQPLQLIYDLAKLVRYAETHDGLKHLNAKSLRGACMRKGWKPSDGAEAAVA